MDSDAGIGSLGLSTRAYNCLVTRPPAGRFRADDGRGTSALRASPSARGRRGGGRAAGIELRDAHCCHPTQAPGSIVRRTCARGVQAARGMPVKWRPPEFPGGSRRFGNLTPPAGRFRADDGRGAFRPPRIPIRTPAVAAPEHGRRAPGRAVGIRLREARYGHPIPATSATRKYRPAQLRHGRAGCASASR